MISGDKNYNIAKESSQQTIIDNIITEVAAINTLIGTTDNIGGMKIGRKIY